MLSAPLERACSLLRSESRPDLYEIGDVIVESVAGQLQVASPAGQDLHQQLLQHRAATIQAVATQATFGCRKFLRQLQTAVSAEGLEAGIEATDLTATTLADPAYLERLAHLTVERVLVFAAAPPLRLSPLPDPQLTGEVGASVVVAVIFDSPLAITHELYPLWTDAFATGQEAATDLVVVGVHQSWLDDTCRARRVITYSAVQDAFHEAPLPTPLGLDVALLLAQSAATHGVLSRRLTACGIAHVNTCAGTAATADDKWACFERWRQADVATPPTCLLAQHLDHDEVITRTRSFVDHCSAYQAGWFVQPRHGTESAGVVWIPPGEGAEDLITAAYEQLATADDVILRPRVGLLQLQTHEGARTFDLRLHVCRHAGQTRAESGYLICAPAATEPVSAVSHGASIDRLASLTSPGLCREDESGTWVAIEWSAADQARALEVAAHATAALDLDLAGVDLKLELIDNVIQPLVLDVNPRPAGLIHADLLIGHPPEAGVGPLLWQRLAALAAASKNA